MRSDYYKRPAQPPGETPVRWQGGYWEHPAPVRAAAPPQRKKGRRAFVIVLILLAAAVTAVLCFNGLRQASFPALDEWGYGYDDDDYDYDPLATAETTIERMEARGDFSLTLSPQPEGEVLSLGEIYDKNIPSIVCITAIGDEGGSQGSGIVLSADGYILTNEHVIHGTGEVTVGLQDGRELDALLVGRDEESDLAVLKVEADDLVPAEFGDSSALRVGDTAVAIGNPLGKELRGTMTSGIVSAINRQVRTEDGTMTLIQTTAAINSGNSGGALINGYGQVVGVTNMKMVSHDVTIEGLGFAIPSTDVKTIVDDLIRCGEVEGTPVLGITITDSGTDGGGAMVYRVDRDSDAYAQGLRTGDVIIACNGKTVTCADDLLEAKDGLEIGDTVTLTVLRDGKEHTISARLMSSKEI